MRSRSGQVTLFVIIGLVLLLVFALFLFMRESEPQVEPSDQTVTHDFSAVKASYEQEAASCLKREGKMVLKRMFAQGGFLDSEEQGFVALEDQPTMGSALPVSQDYLLPYWLEQRSPAGCRDACLFSFNIPPLKDDGGTLPSIEEQLERGVTEGVGACLDRISFSDDYEVTPEQDLSVDVIIGEGSVRYELDRTVRFVYTPTGANMTVEEASALQDVAVKQLYESVRDVMSAVVFQNKSDTIHNGIKQVIEAYSMGRDPALPPMYGGTKFDVNVDDMWLLPDVRDELELRIADNLPIIQVANTADRNIVVEENQYSQAIYHTGPFKPDVFFDHPQYASGVAFNFIYNPDWDLDLRIGPGNGYVIRPQGLSVNPFGLLPGFGIYDYYFTYDVVVPMMLVAEDPSAFDGEGLSFLVGFESGLTTNDPFLYSDAAVLDLDGTGSFFSAEDQRMDGDITINVTDAVTGQALEGVGFTYSCGQAAVDVIDFSGEDGLVTTSLPFCMGGQLTGNRDGYYVDPLDLDVLDDSSRTVHVEAYPLKEFELRLEGRSLTKKYAADAMFDDDGVMLSEFEDDASEVEEYGIDPRTGIWQVGSEPWALRGDDVLTVIFTRHTEPGERNEVQVKMVNYTNVDSLSVELTKGLYDVEAFLITHLGEGHDRERVYIPEDTIRWGEAWLFDGEEGSETIPEVEFNETFYRGGIRLTGSRTLEVAAEDYDEDSLNVKYVAVRIDDLEKHLDLGVLGQVDAYARMYNESLEPRFGEEQLPAQPAE